MIFEKKQEIIYTLVLNKEEALFLKQMMQNPLLANDSDTEDEGFHSMRSKFWKALPSMQELEDE